MSAAGRYSVPPDCCCLLILCVAPAGSIPLAAVQREERLSCQRCVRRLSRAAEIDKEFILSCDKQIGHVLCDYCAAGNRKCLDVGFLSLLRLSCASLTFQVPASCRPKARRLVSLYTKFCKDPSDKNRKRVLDEAQTLGKLMTTAHKKAAASVGGFAGASSAARGHGATLDDINNNLRLLVDAVRRLAEVGGAAVSLFLPCVSHC